MIQLNYRDARPIYEQIKAGLRRLIVSKAIATDDRLPSVREMAASLAINPNTIQRAYRELEKEGYVYTISGYLPLDQYSGRHLLALETAYYQSSYISHGKSASYPVHSPAENRTYRPGYMQTSPLQPDFQKPVLLQSALLPDPAYIFR